MIVELLSTLTTVNFGLGPEARVTGKLVNEQNQPLAGVLVAYDGFSDAGSASLTDANGNFTITNLPAGIGELDVDFSSADPYCNPVPLLVELQADAIKDVGIILIPMLLALLLVILLPGLILFLPRLLMPKFV